MISTTSIRTSHWVAPSPETLPDFIIGGSMKSGTTTLHHILNAHPDVFIPDQEINFFDMDNLIQHSDFNFYDKAADSWTLQLMEENPEKLWNWYLKKFEGKDGCLKGEDSTTYLASSIAAERIAIQKKEIKLIFLLRHPTKRAYSQYFHLLRTGNAVYSFEDTLKFNPYSVLGRSLYKDQLEHYYKFIPKERIKIVLFEDLVKDKENTIKDVCDFLKLDFSLIDKKVIELHSNKVKLPRSIKLLALRNRLLRNFGNTYYFNSLPNKPDKKLKGIPLPVQLLNKVYNRLNALKESKTPPMSQATKIFLDNYFKKELDGLDELIGKEITKKWFF